VLDGHTARRIGTVQRTKWPLARSPAFLLRDKDDEVILRVARGVRKMSPTWSVFDGDGRTVGEILAAMQRYWKPDDIGASGSALIDGAVVAHLRAGDFVETTTGTTLAQLALDSESVPPWKNRANNGRWRLRFLVDVQAQTRLMVFAWLGVEFDLQWVEDHSPRSRMHWASGA